MNFASRKDAEAQRVRVLQVKKYPIVIANGAKRNEAIARAEIASLHSVSHPAGSKLRNDRFWIIYFLEQLITLPTMPQGIEGRQYPAG
jgi:hypothetical protein